MFRGLEKSRLRCHVSGLCQKKRQFYQSVQNGGMLDTFLELQERLDAAERNAEGHHVTGDNA